MSLCLKDIKRLSFDVMWKIDQVELPCVGHHMINVFFGADEMIRDGDWAPLPPTKKQIETLLHIANLPADFIKRESQIIRQFFVQSVESKKIRTSKDINLFKIESHLHVKEILVPYVKAARKHNFIINCACDWDYEQAINLYCRDDKILNVAFTDQAHSIDE